MPDTSKDPVDHARTTRQHAGEAMKAGINAPGIIAIGLGLVCVSIGLFSFANGVTVGGVIGSLLAVLLIAGGLTWLNRAHHKVQKEQREWHRQHPDAHYEPPTS